MMLVLSFSINTRSSLSTSITIVLSATPPGLRMKERESLWIHNFPELVFFFVVIHIVDIWLMTKSLIAWMAPFCSFDTVKLNPWSHKRENNKRVKYEPANLCISWESFWWITSQNGWLTQLLVRWFIKSMMYGSWGFLAAEEVPSLSERKSLLDVCCDYVDDYDDYENEAELWKNTKMFFPTVKAERGLIWAWW